MINSNAGSVSPNMRRAIGGSAGRDARADAEEEVRALQALRAALAVHHEDLDDPGVMLALAEGETSLLETVDILLDADLTDEGLVSGLKTSKDSLALRLSRFEERRKSRRAIIEQALQLVNCKTLERPVATITLSERSPTLVVEEQSKIPARFFDMRPVLNKRMAKDALDAGEDVPGARLSNGTITLTVRRR
jgi:hypothetical protein